MLYKFRIEYLERKDAGDYFNFLYGGQWSTIYITAESEEEAVELLKQCLLDRGIDPEYIENNILIHAV